MPERAFSFGQIIPWLSLKKGETAGGGGGNVRSLCYSNSISGRHKGWPGHHLTSSGAKYSLHPSAACSSFMTFTDQLTSIKISEPTVSIK